MIEFGQYRYDPASQVLYGDGDEIPLPPRVARVLELLIERRGAIASKEELIERAWPGAFVTEDSLTQAVSQLRQLLGDDPQRPAFVETVPRRGYRFIAEICGGPEADTDTLPPPSSDRRPGATATEVRTADAQSKPIRRMAASRPLAVLVATLVAGLILGALAVSWWSGREAGEGRDGGDVWTTVRLTDLPGREWGGSVSPDGDQFVYSGDAAGNLDIYLQFVGGGNVFNLTGDSPQADWAPAIGPDGRIAFRSDREPAGIYLMEPSGENQRLLVADGYQPDWSSDGRIVYSTNGFTDVRDILGGTGLIKVIEVDTRATRELTYGFQPTFSPSGARIAYLKLSDGGRRDVWTVGADGTGAVALTSDESLDWSPRWSPDGRYLYFASDRGGADNIWRIRIDETTGTALSDPEQVTSGGTDRQGFLSFSADGNRLLYTSQQWSSNIQKIAFDPVAEEVVGAPEAVTSGPRMVSHFDLSPDGLRLAFTDTYPQEDIVVMDIGGDNRLRVTDDPARDRRPRWSPDGTRIAVYSDAAGHDYQVWTFDASGGARMRHTTGLAIWYPNWSPDGRRLAFFAPSTAGHAAPGGHIVDADKPFDQQTPVRLPLIDDEHPFFPHDWSANGRLVGISNGGIWLLTTDDESYEDLGLQGADPRWLPDGIRIVYRSRRWSQIRLAHAGRTGESKAILSLPPDELGIPVFSQDLRTLYFLRRERRADIYLLRREPENGR
jgi:Tol biopolymer transport system component/DNA-binding winged helix-turn-helix (wHTH) protein